MKVYPLKDMGEISDCLGIHITRDYMLHTICLDQEVYFTSILSNYGLENYSPVVTSCNRYTAMSPAKDNEERTDQQLYSSIVGSMMWGAVATCLDIT